ncbi:hypothetical protein OIU85_007766 [Salix viminalis]|uniref:Uncharacterized protein n=1 Tax=Salix viminalis TaxID=40686 RepID=A0A9Q0SNB6_SALVM|nr:hypothetical protein OIU85_007766 [Salix viminalis]
MLARKYVSYCLLSWSLAVLGLPAHYWGRIVRACFVSVFSIGRPISTFLFILLLAYGGILQIASGFGSENKVGVQVLTALVFEKKIEPMKKEQKKQYQNPFEEVERAGLPYPPPYDRVTSVEHD